MFTEVETDCWCPAEMTRPIDRKTGRQTQRVVVAGEVDVTISEVVVGWLDLLRFPFR